MDHRFNIDNAINMMLNTKNYWEKFDETGHIPKTYLQSISKLFRSIYVSYNLTSTAMLEKRVQEIHAYRKQLIKLFRVPTVEQRTPAWYAMREGMITASDFGDALGIEKFGQKGNPKGFYEKKCGFKEVVYDENNVFLQWGVMFEEVCCSLYQTRTGIKVHEFGLVKNPRQSFLGASPDGISDLGVMIEIKAPYKRVITEDSVLKQYYYQIQGQLDACDLNECDFLEVKLEKYDSADEFWNDYETEKETYTEEYKEKGIILKRFCCQGNEPKYIYSPPNMTKTNLQDWYQQNNDYTKFETVFWYLVKFTLKRVYKDQIFIDNMNTNLAEVWNNVLEFKRNPEKFEKLFSSRSRTRKVATNANDTTKITSLFGSSSSTSSSTSSASGPPAKSPPPPPPSKMPKKIVGALFIRDDDE